MVDTYMVKKIYNDEFMKTQKGKFFSDKDMKIFKNNVDIYTETGKLLLKFRKNVISEDDTSLLFNNLKSAARLNTGRPDASGIPEGESSQYKYVESKTSGKLLHVLKNKVYSGIIGFYDNISNFGSRYNKNKISCRPTAFNMKNEEKFDNCLPIFKKIDRIYKKLLPDFYKIQHKAIMKLQQQYRIKNTVFTTITVNKNFRTALHKDKGDYENGFGNLLVCSNGQYKGGYTLFPQYCIGIDCRDGDFLVMDVHEWHCNSEISGDGDRLSFVFYLRDKMLRICPR
jgi:hypothetical protein